MPTLSERRRQRPRDPALWVWAAVALMALVPLTEHALAARPRAPAMPSASAPAAPSATAPQSPSAAGTATS